MPRYKGVEFKTIVTDIEGAYGFHAQFSITEHKENEVINHHLKAVMLAGEDDLAVFASSSEAQEAAEQEAIKTIDGLAG